MTLIDIFDDRYQHTGVCDKKTAHREALWHRTFSCLAINPTHRTVLLQKKSPDRYSFERPDYADITVGGHYHAGEDIPDGVREIHEELGLPVPYTDLQPLGVRQTAVTLAPDYIEREFQHWQLLHKHKLTARGFVLATLHRPENVDYPEILDLLLTQLASIEIPVILPLHPRTARRIDEFRLAHRLALLQTTEPLDYPDFLALAHSAAMLISDSGGVQEEASVVKTPIIIVRRSTERPEIEPTFGLRITPSRDLGALAQRWLHRSDRYHQYLADLPAPFGDGTASHRITRALDQLAQPLPIPEPSTSTPSPRPNQ